MIDLQNVPQSAIREILDGLEAGDTALPDRIFGTQLRMATTMSGSIPRYLVEHGVKRGNNMNMQPLEEAEEYEDGIGSLSYNALGSVGLGFISDEHKNDLGVYGVDAVANGVQQAVQDANTALNRKMATLLTNTTSNAEADVTSTLYTGAGDAAWSDGGTASTPYEDLLYIVQELCPSADFFVMGRAVAAALRVHDDIKARLSNYSAGGVTDDELKAFMASNFGLAGEIFNKKEALYNSAAKGQTMSRVHLMPNGLWIGERDALVQIHPNHPEQDNAEINRVTRKRAYEVQYTRYDDLQVSSTDLGVTVTATIA